MYDFVSVQASTARPGLSSGDRHSALKRWPLVIYMKFLYSSPQTTTKVSSINTGRSILYVLYRWKVYSGSARKLWNYGDTERSVMLTSLQIFGNNCFLRRFGRTRKNFALFTLSSTSATSTYENV